MIPHEKRAAVTRGLHEAFGTDTFDDMVKMTRGLSSDLIFRIVVRDSPYLLRIMMVMDERNDPRRHFACMEMAADGGIAPQVRYANENDGIAITDFVEAVPLSVTQALVEIPRTLRRLHTLPAFPKSFNYVTAHNGFQWRFRKAGILDSREVEEVFRQYDRVCATYPRLDSDIVSSHSDLKPENILFDGKRIWLVDWQAAFLNDRYFDLGVVGNFVMSGEDDEVTFLSEYFGHAPDAYQRARFFLMRQVVHMFYAAVFLMLGSGGKAVDVTKSVPSFQEFHRAIWAGEINLADRATRIVYARVHWERLLENVRRARFEEALRVVAERHTTGGQRLLPSDPNDQGTIQMETVSPTLGPVGVKPTLM